MATAESSPACVASFVLVCAVAKKPVKPEGEPEVPVVPHRLAVHKRRPWWAQAARVVVGTAAMAVAGAAGAAAAAKHQQVCVWQQQSTS